MTKSNDILSRRKALSILGLGALAAYAAPVVLDLSEGSAQSRDRSRSRSRTRGRRRGRMRPPPRANRRRVYRGNRRRSRSRDD